MTYSHYSKPLMSLMRKGAHAKSPAAHSSELRFGEVKGHHQTLDKAAMHGVRNVIKPIKTYAYDASRAGGGEAGKLVQRMQSTGPARSAQRTRARHEIYALRRG